MLFFLIHFFKYMLEVIMTQFKAVSDSLNMKQYRIATHFD